MWLRRTQSSFNGAALGQRIRQAQRVSTGINQLDTLWAMQLRNRSNGKAALVETNIQSIDSKKPVVVTTAAKRNAASRASIKQELAHEDQETITPTTQRTTRKRVKKEEPVLADQHAEGNPQNKKKNKKAPSAVVVVTRDGADGTPTQWEAVLRGIQQMRSLQVADVDVAGVEVMFEGDGDAEGNPFAPHVTRFHVLISAMLSSQTKDPVNFAAMKRLIKRGLNVQEMLDIEEKELATLLHPVGFFNNKAKYIKQVAQLLTDRAATTAEEDPQVVDIPDTYEELVALPGIGPKMAHLIMSCAWNNTVGICVDTHVHRISNRLGWAKTWNFKNQKAQNPEKTRLELEDWLPKEYWHPINVTLVGFGQTICLPRAPKCDQCTVSHLCPSANRSTI